MVWECVPLDGVCVSAVLWEVVYLFQCEMGKHSSLDGAWLSLV